MKKYRKAKSKYIAVCSLTLWLYQPVNAQIEITTLPDSVITVGYARGTLKNISGSVEQITEQQMNKEQITNPLEAIQGRVPGLTIMKSSNGTAALESVRMRGTTSLTSGNDPLIIVGRFKYADFDLSDRYRKFYNLERCLRNSAVRFSWCLGCD